MAEWGKLCFILSVQPAADFHRLTSPARCSLLPERIDEKMLLLGEALPEFACELEHLLREKGRPDLAAQVAELPVLNRCRCGQNYCALFDTAPGGTAAGKGPPETVKFETRPGTLILDVRSGRIRCIEALDRADVRDRLRALLP